MNNNIVSSRFLKLVVTNITINYIRDKKINKKNDEKSGEISFTQFNWVK